MEKTSSSSSESGFIKSRGSVAKNPAVSALQDLLFYQLTGVAAFAHNVMDLKKSDKITNKKITRLLYLTNKGINFSINSMLEAIQEAFLLKNRVENLYRLTCKNQNKKPKKMPLATELRPADTLAQIVSQANVINAQKTIKTSNFNIYALQEIIRKSLSASANYLEHIKSTETIEEHFYRQIYEILNFLTNENKKLSEVESFALKAGELHTLVLEKLIANYEKTYGLIQRKEVSVLHKKGSAILVAGDDFAFLSELLKQTEGKSINIYTYGALNYAHAFPEINKYKHLVGIFLGEYDNFTADIENFPGVVVLTSGNIEEITDVFRGRIYSVENIAMLGVNVLGDNPFKTLLNSAYDAQGFEQSTEEYFTEVGFGLKELEFYTEKLYKDLKNNKIKNIEILLGCNNFLSDKKNSKQRNKLFPSSSFFIFTDGLFLERQKHFQQTSRNILNFGQYINLYTLVRLLFSLSGKCKKDINVMPINITVNLNSPDTIAALLMFLSLGIKNIKINSTLPNYLTDSILKTFWQNNISVDKAL